MEQNLIPLNGGLHISDPTPIDDRLLGDSLSEYLTRVPKSLRYIGLSPIIRINGVSKKYWFKSGIEDADLVLYNNDITIPDPYGYWKLKVIKPLYGGLYNWYTIGTHGGLVNPAYPDFRVPSDTDWNTLITTLGGSTVAGGAMKESGTTHWETPNTGATNSSGFTALPGGRRAPEFSGIGTGCNLWTSTAVEGYIPPRAKRVLIYNTSINVDIYQFQMKLGFSIRLVRDAITGEPNTSYYYDIEGNQYECIKIGNQVWITGNLYTEYYADGTPIPNITDDTAWEALTTGGMCYYNNAKSTYATQVVERQILSHDLVELSPNDIKGLVSILAAKSSKPISSTDNAIVRFNGTNGETQDSIATISDAGEISTIAVGETKIGISGKANFIGVHGEGLAEESYGVTGSSNYIPSQFCNTQKTVTGIKTVQKFRGNSDNLDGPVEAGYGLKQTYNLPTNSFPPTETYNAEKEAGSTYCVWENASINGESSAYIINLMKDGLSIPSVRFTGNGKIYTWNSPSGTWIELSSTSGEAFVPLSGGSMTGTLNVTVGGLNYGIKATADNLTSVWGSNRVGYAGRFSKTGVLTYDDGIPVVEISRNNSGEVYQSAPLIQLFDSSTVTGYKIGALLQGFIDSVERLRFNPRVANDYTAIAHMLDTLEEYTDDRSAILELRTGGIKKFKVSGKGSVETPRIKLTPEGGYAVLIANKTGTTTIKGTIVTKSNSFENAIMINPASAYLPLGIVYESGVADGEECWIVISGKADVLFDDGVAPQGTYFAVVSSTPGTVIQYPNPSAYNMRIIGTVLESKTSGTNVLAKCMINIC